MLFTTFPVRKTLNTKHIKRYATAHKSIKNTNLPGYRQSFPKCRLFHEYAHSGEAGRVPLALIRAAALKIDGTALSTVSALSWVILYSSPFHHICFTVTPLGWTAASPDILSCADIAWNSRILVLIHFFFPSDKNKTTLVSLSIHALLHTSVLSFLYQSLTSKSMRGAWKYSFFVIIQQGLYQFLC